MCTLVLLRATRRRRGRCCSPPTATSCAAGRACRRRRHWPDRPHVRGGLDSQAGGTWLGLNDDGRGGGRAQPPRHARAGARQAQPRRAGAGGARPCRGAAPRREALRALDPAAWRPFNLIVADADRRLLAAARRRRRRSGCSRSQTGLHMIEAGELDDPASARIGRFLPQFRFVPAPDPAAGDWSAWEALLAERTARTGDPRDAMCIVTDGEYGTVSSAPGRPAAARHRAGRSTCMPRAGRARRAFVRGTSLAEPLA